MASKHRGSSLSNMRRWRARRNQPYSNSTRFSMSLLISHDFENVEYQADDFDLALGMPGLHTVRRKVEWVERQSVLPPELFQRFENDMFWRAPDANIREAAMGKNTHTPESASDG
jgi:hypothetical protein